MSTTSEDVEAAVLDLLHRTPRHAELVSRLLSAMRRRDVERDTLEEALAALEQRSAILVREHYCADPHLEAADLRVAAVLEDVPGGDPTTSATERIEAVWQRWLAEYLSNHTCV
jgi:glutathione S-transferase